MSTLKDFNSPEKQVLLSLFNKIPLMDNWIASLIENYIYGWVEEHKDCGHFKAYTKYRIKYGEKDGDYFYYINDNLVRKATYKDGKRHGEYIEWYSDYPPLKLPKHMYFKCEYKNDLMDGEYKQWHINRKLIEKSYYKKGELNGERKTWFPDESLRSICFYKEGVKDGEYVEYWDNQRPYIKCKYINGILDGEYNEWYSNGTLRIMYEYSNGVKTGNCKDWYYRE